MFFARIRHILYSNSRILIYFCIVVGAMVMMNCLFDSAIGTFSANGSQILLIGVESVFLSSFLFLLKGRWKTAVPVFAWLTALFYMSNLLYYRYWHDLLPLSQVFDVRSYNGFVFGSVPTLLRPADILFLLLPSAVTSAYRLMGIGRCRQMSLPHASGIVACAFLIWCGAEVMSAMATFRYWRSADCPTSFSKELRARFIPQRDSSRLAQWRSKELLFYLYHQISTSASMSPIELSEAQCAEIDNFISSIPRQGYEADTLYRSNRGKNLIFIIVESLNADAVGKTVGGLQITPTLDSLINTEGTISCLTMIPQISDGSSSDGQFIYNTGLLPLRGDAVAMSFADNAFHSLPEAIGYGKATEVIFESADVWNHRKTSAAYHYDMLTDNLDAGERTIDETVFEEGLAVIDTLPRPFMAELVSLGMHYPYKDPNVTMPAELKTESLDMEMRYLAALHAFDTALSRFIGALKAKGIYDDSVIVLVSDHDNEPSGKAIRHDIVFIAANTGTSMKIERPVGQIDVYPTILRIMGVDAPWKGIGMSMLDERNSSAAAPDGTLTGTSGATVDSLKARAWVISELIIRGDRFAR